jgi:hypothetical protein
MGPILAAQLEEVEVQRAQSAGVNRGTRALVVAWVLAAADLPDSPSAVALLDALLDVALTWVREKVEPEFDSLSSPAFRQTVFSHSKP